MEQRNQSFENKNNANFLWLSGSLIIYIKIISNLFE